jgi:signal transduction histidine kinase
MAVTPTSPASDVGPAEATAALMSSGPDNKLSAMMSAMRFDALLRLGLAVFLLVALVYFIPVLPSPVMQQVDDYFAELILLSVAVVLFASAALQSRDATSRNFWILLCGSFCCWLMAHLLGYGIRFETPWLFDFVKDVLLLGMNCLAVIAVDLRPGLIKSPLQTLRGRLAALSSVLLIVGVFGYTSLVPAMAGISEYKSPFEVYAILDAYIAIRYLAQARLSTSRAWRMTLALVGSGFAFITVADLMVVVYDSGIVTYRPGQPLNLLWFVFYVPLYLASRVMPGSPQVLPPAERGDWSNSLNLGPLLAYSVALPLIHLGGYGFGFLAETSRSVRDIFVLAWLAGATAGICWQYLLLRSRLREIEAEKQAAEKESKDLQAQLRQAQRIELVGQLTGGLAHEFGNSLFGAESFAQKILRDVESKTQPVQEKHARGLLSALAGSRDLVRKFNYLGRGEDLRSVVVNVAEEVGNTIELLRSGISRSIELQYHSEQKMIGAIARSQDLQQITLNLVLNARDAVGERGFIDVAVGQGMPETENCASCGAMIAGEHVWIRVSDSGPGVPEKLRHRIFEPLVTSKPTGKGSGLGLSIVHTLVHQLRGHIVLGESRPAHCTFTVLIPAVQLDVSGPLGTKESPRRHVLAIESDHVLAESFRSNPILHDLHINRVTSAEAAAVILQQPDRTPDTVIIGNLASPIDVVAIIDAAEACKRPCRVVLCARRSQRAILASLDGIDTFIDQPVDADIFASVLLRSVTS